MKKLNIIITIIVITLLSIPVLTRATVYLYQNSFAVGNANQSMDVYGYSPTYATAYNTPYATGVSSPLSEVMQYDISGEYGIHRAFLAFDTSSLTGQNVTSAILSLAYYSVTGTVYSNIQVQKWNSSDTAITTSDYNNFNNVTYGTISAVDLQYTFTHFTTGEYWNISLTTSAINITGLTKFCLRTTGDSDKTAPTSGNREDGFNFYRYTPYIPILYVYTEQNITSFGLQTDIPVTYFDNSYVSDLVTTSGVTPYLTGINDSNYINTYNFHNTWQGMGKFYFNGTYLPYKYATQITLALEVNLQGSSSYISYRFDWGSYGIGFLTCYPVNEYENTIVSGSDIWYYNMTTAFLGLGNLVSGNINMTTVENSYFTVTFETTSGTANAVCGDVWLNVTTDTAGLPVTPSTTTTTPPATTTTPGVISLLDLPAHLAVALGISTLAAGLLCGFFLELAFVLPVLIFTDNTLVIMIFSIIGLCIGVVLGWLPYVCLILIILIIALLYAGKVRDLLTGGSTGEEK